MYIKEKEKKWNLNENKNHDLRQNLNHLFGTLNDGNIMDEKGNNVSLFDTGYESNKMDEDSTHVDEVGDQDVHCQDFHYTNIEDLLEPKLSNNVCLVT